MMMEQRDNSLRFRWLVGLAADNPVGDASTFDKNRHLLLRSAISQRFFELLLERDLMSGEENLPHQIAV